MDNELEVASKRFVKAFEEVFHWDWPYSKGNICSSRAAEVAILTAFGEQVPPESTDTFLTAHRDDLEDINWGNFAVLMKSYARLCEVMGTKSVRGR